MSFKIIGIGEVLWDLLPTGPRLGGAPANFACHARALGAQASVVTRIGNDALGVRALERFREMNLPTAMVQTDDQFPTGTVAVTLADHGIPHFAIHEHVAWDHLADTREAVEAVRQADAVCFGSLAQRTPSSRAAVQRLLAAAPAEALRIFDINLRQNFYSPEVIEQSLRLANVLKLNDEELIELARLFELSGEVKAQIEWLANKFGLKAVVLTCGPRGSLIFTENRWSEQPAQAVQVVDTVGAGDSFAAALAIGLLSKMEISEVHAIASDVASYVCSQAGATPPLPDIFRTKFSNRLPANGSHKSPFNPISLSNSLPATKQTTP